MTNNILFVLAYKNFHSDEYFHMRNIFIKNNMSIYGVSTYLGNATSDKGLTAKIDMLFSEVNGLFYDAVIFIGGIGAIGFWDDWRAQGIARIFFENNKIVAGIGNGAIVIANSGILKNGKATCDAINETIMKINDIEIIDDSIVQYENIITSKSSDIYVKDFTTKIIEEIKLHSKD